MTEEEIIEQIKNDLNVGEFYGITEEAVQGLLDLYNKQKEEIERLKNAEEYSKLGKETLLDAIHKQEKENKELKKYDYRNIKIDDNNKIYSIHFSKEELHWMNFGIALYISMQNFDELNDENDI